MSSQITGKPRLSKSWGQSLTEYALITALVSIAGVAALTAVGNTISLKFGDIHQILSTVQPGG